MVCTNQVVFANNDSKTEAKTFLFVPRVDRIIYEDEIYAVKQGSNFYYSLNDFIRTLGLAIELNQNQDIGHGWFLREDWVFNIDVKQKIITSRKNIYDLHEDHIFYEQGQLLVRGDLLQQVFNMQFQIDTAQQYIEIDSPYPLPDVARYYRGRFDQIYRQDNNIPKLPRQKLTYDWFDINAANVRVRGQQRSGSDTSVFGSYSASLGLAGQFLKHEAYSLIAADSQNKISSVVARLSKKSEEADLLGVLQARQYNFGDINTTDIPLTGDSRQELGFRASNSLLGLSQNQFQTIDINGDAIPGWDVELYRKNILLDSLVVEDDGFYEFSDVQLFANDNEFEIFFYGPQGEIRTRDVNVPVASDLFKSQNGVYDVSVSLSETRSFQQNEIEDVDKGTPHIAARYNKLIGRTLAYVGGRSRSVEGENMIFLTTGMSSVIANSVIDTNIAVNQDADATAQVTVRKKIKDWNISMNSLIQDEDYKVNNNENPNVFQLSGGVQKSFNKIPSKTPTQQNVSLVSRFAYDVKADSSEQITGVVGLGYQTGSLSLSNNLNIRDTKPVRNKSLTVIDNSFSFRKKYDRFNFRGGVDYNIEPFGEFQRYLAQINYNFYERPLSGEVRIEHNPSNDETDLNVALNHIGQYVRTSSFMEIDDDFEFRVGVNLNFNLVDLPHQVTPYVTSDPVIGRGLISSFVYHDKNGNLIYDADDMPIENANIETLNVKRQAQTNEKGYSFIHDLPTGRATDIELDDDTLPDPYMIAAKQSVSIFPDAGEIVELNFPVHLSGEVEGTLYLKDKKGKTTALNEGWVKLYPVRQGDKKKTMEVSTAFDGYYVASLVPPGKYMMMVSDRTAKKSKSSISMPRFIDIGYKGEIMYDHNFTLDQTKAFFPIDVTYHDDVSDAPLMASYTLKITARPKSKLLSLLSDLQNDGQQDQLWSGLEKIGVDAQNQQIYKSSSQKLADNYQKCQDMANRAILCTLQIHLPSRVQQMQTALR